VFDNHLYPAGRKQHNMAFKSTLKMRRPCMPSYLDKPAPQASSVHHATPATCSQAEVI
jgi:hypothetical protein